MTITRETTRIIGMATLFAAGAVAAPGAGADDAPLRVYIGTYTGEKSRGIYLSTLDPVTGALSPAEVAAEVKNPSFLAIHPNRQFLYAVSEVDTAGGKPTGGISAYS